MPAPTTKITRSRFSFFILEDYKKRITAVLDEARKVGALPMSCDGLAAFINEAIGEKLQKVEHAVKAARKK